MYQRFSIRPITRTVTVALLLLLALPLAACGGDDDEPSAFDRLGQARDAAAGASKMVDEVERMAEEQEAGITYEPVDFRRLRALLPDQLAGLPRESVEGEKSGAMGVTLSKATATYLPEEGAEAEGPPPRLEVTLTDLGAVRGFAMMGLAAWSMAEIDRESSTGYERTTEYRGHPAYEKYEAEGTPHAELQVIVADRFLIQAEGWAVEVDRLKEALGDIDVGALEDMKEEGRTTAPQAG